jgi:hypothetical protein
MNRSAVRVLAKHLMVVLGCVHMVCGPQGALQAVAWASMLASYSLEDGLAKGVVDTFSGERPCAMCVKLAEMKHDGEQSPDAPAPERRTSAPGMAQDWQASRDAKIDPPAWGDIGGGGCRPPVCLGGDSRLPGGPDAPPPRFV